MSRNREARRLLVKEVWPDKLLYGAIMLTVAGLLGFVHAAIALTTNVSFATSISPIFEGFPVWATLLFSLATLTFGLLSWRRLSVMWGVLGGITGLLSLSLFAIGSLHALIALVFLALAAREGEHRVPEADRLTRLDWPDKALTASLLLLMAGIAAIAWGIGVVTEQVAWAMSPVVWGSAQIVSGAIAVVAAAYLYNERAPLLGTVAGLLCIATFAAYFLAPGLAVAGIIAILLGRREGEFSGNETPGAQSRETGRSRGVS